MEKQEALDDMIIDVDGIDIDLRNLSEEQSVAVEASRRYILKQGLTLPASFARMKANSGVLESPGQARSFESTFVEIRTELMDKFQISSFLSKQGTCPKKGPGNVDPAETSTPGCLRQWGPASKLTFLSLFASKIVEWLFRSGHFSLLIPTQKSK